jgi:pSer/pThr/pTyr-binding forkhead associated (FHA) protein
MITCPRCHHQNLAHLSQCELCGATLPAPKSTLPPEVDGGGDFLDELDPIQFDSHGALNADHLGASPPHSNPIPKPQPLDRAAADAHNPAGLARLLHDALAGGTDEKPIFSAPPPQTQIDPGRLTNPVLKPVPQLPSLSGRERKPAEDFSNQELSDFLLDALSHTDNAHSLDPISLEPLSEDLDREPEKPSFQAPGLHPHGSIKCGTCHRANPEGMLYCVYCGASLEDQSLASQSLSELHISSLSDTYEAPCPQCNHNNPASNLFCGACGHKLQPTQVQASPQEDEDPRIASGAFSAVARKPSPWDIRLVSINEDGSDGLEVSLEHTKTIVGRTGDTRFPTDAFLSPKHACLTIEHNDLHIEDLYSLNGTFLRLRDEVTLTAGDVVLMGRQVLRFEKFEQTITPKARSSDGTRYMGSPLPGGQYKLLQVGIGGVIQNVYCIPESGAVLGREKGDIIFPRDKFMSGRHAQIYPREDGSYCLVDLNSSNGTWLKIWEKTRLQNGDFIFMGQQLFRIEIRALSKPTRR